MAHSRALCYPRQDRSAFFVQLGGAAFRSSAVCATSGQRLGRGLVKGLRIVDSKTSWVMKSPTGRNVGDGVCRDGGEQVPASSVQTNVPQRLGRDALSIFAKTRLQRPHADIDRRGDIVDGNGQMAVFVHVFQGLVKVAGPGRCDFTVQQVTEIVPSQQQETPNDGLG